MEKEFLIVDFNPKSNVDGYALTTALIGENEAVEPESIGYVTENEYDERIIVPVSKLEKDIFDGSTLLLAVDKEYQPRSINVIRYNSESGEIKPIETILENVDNESEHVSVDEPTLEDDSIDTNDDETSLNHVVNTILPTSRELYERINEPLKVDAELLNDREVVLLKSQFDTSLLNVSFIIGDELDDLVRTGKFDESARQIAEKLKQAPTDSLLKYRAALMELEQEQEEVRNTVDEIKSSYERRKQEAWNEHFIEWEREYHMVNPDDSEVRAANYVLSRQPIIADLNKAVVDNKLEAETDVLRAVVEGNGDRSTARLMRYLRMQELYQRQLDEVANAIKSSKQTQVATVDVQPTFEDVHEVEHEENSEFVQPQELPNYDEAETISEDTFESHDLSNDDFEAELAKLDADFDLVSLDEEPKVEPAVEKTVDIEAPVEEVENVELSEHDSADLEHDAIHDDLLSSDSFEDNDVEATEDLVSHVEEQKDVALEDDEDLGSDDIDFSEFDDEEAFDEYEEEDVKEPKSKKKLGLGAKFGIGAGLLLAAAAVGMGAVMLMNPDSSDTTNEPTTSEQASAEESEATTVKPLVSVGDTLVITKADKKEYTVKVLEVLPDGSVYTDGGDNGEKIHITYEQLQKKFGQ
jgi:hypothetical protein